MKIVTRRIESDIATDVYINASVTPNLTLQEQANELFSGIRRVLESERANILQERVFVTEDALETVRPIRKRIYGGYDDGVEPAWLVVPKGINGQIAGVQVHALTSVEAPKTLHLGDCLCGRIIHSGNIKYLTVSCIRASEAGQPINQMKAMLEKAEAILKQEGFNLHSVPRTWIWLKDIHTWYDDFNRVRNSFFNDHGLIGNSTANRMPASTGIGISPGNGAICGMDLVAVAGMGKPIDYLDAGGNQDSALKYGSAFSRASRVRTPAGTTVFVSGTASIDADGKSTNTGDVSGQIEASICNVRSVLRDMKCRDEDVVQAVAYCETTEIEKVFLDQWSDLAWPNLTVIADICRDDLLFEIEATAVIAGASQA